MAAGQGAGDLITGEAVPLELRLARWPTRGLALAIDLTVQVFALIVVFGFAGWLLTEADEAIVFAVTLALFVLVVIGYPTILETLTRGRTLGKLVFGLRVVSDDGGPERFRQALVRALFEFFVDVWLTLGSVALISSTLSATGKRVGDHFAGTVVVREKVPASAGMLAAYIGMPPPLAGWAATADLSRVPDDLALTARQFVLRAPSMAPDVRAAMAPQLATRVAAYVAPASPPGTPAEAYLAAVLAERSRRAMWAAQWAAQQGTQAAPPAVPSQQAAPPAVPPTVPPPFPPAVPPPFPPVPADPAPGTAPRPPATGPFAPPS